MTQAMTMQDMSAMLAAMQAELAATKQALAVAKSAPAKISLKVGESGTVCLQHGARYPIALYASQWARILPWLRDGGIDTIEAFITTNHSLLEAKGGIKA